jgi:hypothetical protein
MIDYVGMYGVYITLYMSYLQLSHNYITSLWFSDVAFTLLITHIFIL